MEFEQALEIINAAKYARFSKHLSDVETVILKGAWQNQTYDKIAENSCYSESYLKQSAGPQLWSHLSQALGESVSKTNFRTAVERQWLRIAKSRPDSNSKQPHNLDSQQSSCSRNHQSLPQQHFDWGNASDVRQFYGRQEELEILARWIQIDRCQLLALLGMGGIGKTTLAIKLAEQIQGEFNYIIWRSLRNAPSITDLLQNILQFISGQSLDELPNKFDDQLLALIAYFRSSRCLLVFDGLESILKSHDRTGRYQDNHKEYDQLFKCIAETNHNSCLIFTSRERPKGLAAFEGSTLSFRFLQVQGLSSAAGKEIFQLKNISSELDKQLSIIVENYTGNPFSLKIICASINKLFDGDIYKFIGIVNIQPFIFDDIRDLFNEQISRLTNLQLATMYWLSVVREPLTADQLKKFFPATILFDELLHGLESLKSHSLIKKFTDKFTLEPFIIDYTINYFVESLFQEIINQKFFTLKKYSLINSKIQSHAREKQARFIIVPILKKLFLHFGSPKTTSNYLNEVLNTQKLESTIELECINENIVYIQACLQAFLDRLNNPNQHEIIIQEINLRTENYCNLQVNQAKLKSTLPQSIINNLSMPNQAVGLFLNPSSFQIC
ncbi:MAG: NACHT domain-containing protein [Acaryochloris sp. RU_4_1]|nr:NACHT domain-containing protein [Acaryochloris sp. RU_4_1]NJR54677.1 NACHT domain-containing protein [Acaryochloris sp. CRU_2_0]